MNFFKKRKGGGSAYELIDALTVVKAADEVKLAEIDGLDQEFLDDFLTGTEVNEVKKEPLYLTAYKKTECYLTENDEFYILVSDKPLNMYEGLDN